MSNVVVADDKIFSNEIIERSVIKSFLLSDMEKAIKNIQCFKSLGLDVDCFTNESRTFISNKILSHYKVHNELPSLNFLMIEIDRLERNTNLKNELVEICTKTKWISTDREAIYQEARRYSLLRKATVANNNLLLKLFDAKKNISDSSPEKILQETIEELTSHLLIHGSYKDTIREGSVFENTFLEELRWKKENPESVKGIDTGIPILTDASGGWNAAELIIVSGRPGQGKSLLLMNFAYQAYLDGKNVLFFTLEMPFRQQQQRCISRATGVPYFKIKKPYELEEKDIDLISFEMDRHNKEKENIFYAVDPNGDCTVQKVENKISELENKLGIKFDIVFIDPIYLMKLSSVPTDKREKEDPTGMISSDLKLLAMRLQIPIIVASQINREGGKRHKAGKDPDAMDLAFTDRLTQNADIIFILTVDFNDLAYLHAVKFRDGANLKIVLKREFKTMRFVYDPELNGIAA